MKKRIEFFFDENSITESTDAEIEAVITLHNGSVVILPKAHCVIECAPTQRAADGYPAPPTLCPDCGLYHDKNKTRCTFTDTHR